MEYAQAQEAYKKAYQVAKELGDEELIGSALARQGVTFIQQDKPKEAIKYLTGALHTIDRFSVPVLKGYTLQALSEAYAKAQQSQESWRSLGQAERILERHEHSQEKSRSRFNSSSVLAQKGVDAVLLQDHECAIALIDKSLINYDPTMIRGRARLIAQRAEAYCGLRSYRCWSSSRRRSARFSKISRIE
jgi:tetratricopeptide (TPR) repeat protein